VLTTVNELRDRGITVVSLTENFDLGTKEGRFMCAVLAAAAEYELELRAERQAEGIAAAKRREATGAMLPWITSRTVSSSAADNCAIAATGVPLAEAMMISARRTRIDSCRPRRTSRCRVCPS
jgi:hypothetical protein